MPPKYLRAPILASLSKQAPSSRHSTSCYLDANNLSYPNSIEDYKRNPLPGFEEELTVLSLPQPQGKKGNYKRAGAFETTAVLEGGNRLREYLPRNILPNVSEMMVSSTKKERQQKFRLVKPENAVELRSAISSAVCELYGYADNQIVDRVVNFLEKVEYLMRLANSQFYTWDHKNARLREVLTAEHFRAYYWYTSLPQPISQLIQWGGQSIEFLKEVPCNPGDGDMVDDNKRTGKAYSTVKKFVAYAESPQGAMWFDRLLQPFIKNLSCDFTEDPRSKKPRGEAWADIEDDPEEQAAHPSAIPIAAALKALVIGSEKQFTQAELEWIQRARQQRSIPDKAYNVAIPAEHELVNTLSKRAISDNPKLQARDLVGQVALRSPTNRHAVDLSVSLDDIGH